MQRSRFIEILNVPHSGNELSWQLGDGRVRKGTPPVSTHLRPCWTAFFSILRDELIWFIWSVLFIWLIWFNQIYETNQTRPTS
jgi:hypothetical protein